jgi:hypothetical protein
MASGQPVIVAALTSTTSQVTASPDGSFRSDDAAIPVRFKSSDGTWTGIDPTLIAKSDGTIAPAATPSGLVLSAGGTGPLATMTGPGGDTLAFTLPFALPAPVLSGDTALYQSVLPGVDISVTASPAGGWREVLILHSAAAAANPQVQHLALATSGSGLKMAADAAGNITATAADGSVRFASSAPMMWDSTTTTLASPAAKTRTAQSAQSLGTSAPANPATASTTSGPSDQAKSAPLTVTAGSGRVDLGIDTSKLGSQVTWPVYADPGYNPVTANSAMSGYAQVQERYPDNKEFNGTTDGEDSPAIGYCGFSDCNDNGHSRTRAYFTIGINSTLTSVPSGAAGLPTVKDATLYTNVNSSSSPGTSAPIGVYQAGNLGTANIDGNTTWNNQPCGTGGTMTGCAKITGASHAGLGGINFTVATTMTSLINKKATSFTFGLAPDDENNSSYREHFSTKPADAPHIVTTYDFTPTIWAAHTTPTPGFASNPSLSNGCQTPGTTNPWDNPGWVGSNSTITLTASTWSPTGSQVMTQYHIWDDNNTSWSSFPATGWAGSYNNPGPGVSVGALADGHQYGWTADATDGYLTSDTTPWCYFRVDRTNPTVGISSTSFPLAGHGDTPAAVGTAGTFVVNGNDAAPGSGLRASGVACLRFSTTSSDTLSDTGWGCNSTSSSYKVAAADANGNASFTWTPQNVDWGTNTVYAQAMDNAGNYSQVAAYTFYVPWNPKIPAVLGDIDGDTHPDILLPDKNGNLQIIGPTTDPSTSHAAAADTNPAASDPAYSNTTWNDYQISHFGSLSTGRPVDDVIAHNAVDANLKKSLYDIRTDYRGGINFDRAPLPLTKPSKCADLTNGTAVPLTTCPSTYNSADWSTTTQVIAIGTPGSPSNNAPAGDQLQTITDPGTGTQVQANVNPTSLLAIENGNLWLYTPNTSAGLDHTTAELVSNSGNWGDYELIAPGAASGITTTTGAGVPTVWARNRAAGTIHAYPITLNTDGTPNFTSFSSSANGYLWGNGISPSAYPIVGSAGDLNGDGKPDLWGTTPDGSIIVWTSNTNSASAVTGFNAAITLGKLTPGMQLISPLTSSGQHLCVDDYTRSTAPGNIIDAYPCNNSNAQKWTLGADHTVRALGMCLDAAGGGTGNGTKIDLNTCNSGATNQQWVAQAGGELKNPASGRCLADPGANTTAGTQLILWDCYTDPNNLLGDKSQNWKNGNLGTITQQGPAS